MEEEEEDGDEEFVRNPECPVAGHSGPVLSLDFSPNGKQFVSGSLDRLVKIWDTETGAEVCDPGGSATTFFLFAMVALVFWR